MENEMQHTATYQPTENKLRIYPAERLDAETYAKVKLCGYRWAPKQGVFFASWTPRAEDVAIELCGCINDEDMTPDERAAERAERFEGYSASRAKDADAAYNSVKRISDCIPFGQPILVGHHSEGRHRALIQRNWDRMGKSVEFTKLAEERKDKAEYWEKLTNKVDLSMPESIEYFEHKLEKAKERHEGLKNGTIQREHSFSLTYANKEVKDLEDKVKTAYKLWA